MTLPEIIDLSALVRGDYDAELADAAALLPPEMRGPLAPTTSIPIRIPGRNIMKVRTLIDVLDDSPLQVGNVELYLEIDHVSPTKAVARLVAGAIHPGDHDVVDATDAITLIEHTSIEDEPVKPLEQREVATVYIRESGVTRSFVSVMVGDREVSRRPVEAVVKEVSV